jgi:lipopolysaccharide export system ATP-binding protein
MNALIADCVSKSFGATRVLGSATLRAVPRQVRALFGRNGQGKSTLFKIAVGCLQPDSGVVRVGTTTFLHATLPTLATHGVFYLPDHALLSRTMRLGQQLALFERRYARGRLDEACRVTRITTLLDRSPGTLSGGELRRAELAVALTREPTVLIADEPYRGVAPADHDELTRLFRAIAAAGCAVVVSGHEVPSLLAAADHVTWCTEGTTYELGSPDEACAHEGFRRNYLGLRAR